MKNTIRYAACAMVAIVGGNWLLAEPPESKKSDSEKKSKTANVPRVDSTYRTEPASPFPTIPTPSKTVYANGNAYGTNPAAAFNATYPNATGSPQHSQGATSITPSTPPVFGGYSMGTIGPVLPGINPSQTYGAPFVVSGTHQPLSPEEMERNKAFLEAVNQLRGQKTEEDKSSAREKLSKLVSEQLDADLKKREDELVRLRSRKTYRYSISSGSART